MGKLDLGHNKVALAKEELLEEEAGIKVEPVKVTETGKICKPKRKIFTWKRLVVVILLALVFGGGFFGFKIIKTLGKVVAKNTTGSAPALVHTDLKPENLAGEGDGRINILLLGMGGEGHDGGTLTDTIMLVSIEPVSKKVAMLSIPRDLYVPIRDYGSYKINVAHAIGEESKDQIEGGGPALAKEVVSSVLDLPVHYFVRVDFEGFEKLIDEIDGVDVNVPEDLYDPLYPDENYGYEEFSISAGEQQMDGATALKYARSRETTSDFDRARRQQIIISAIRDKFLTLEILTNLSKISNTLDILGDHLKTDLQLWEMEKLAKIAKDIDMSSVTNVVLSDAPDSYLYGDLVPEAGYVLLPQAGDFSEIQKFVHSVFKDEFVAGEAAKIEVQNGTSYVGLASRVAEQLEGYNYAVVGTKDADSQDYKKTVIIDYSGGKKPFTVAFLKKRLNADVKIEKQPEGTDVDLVVIAGENAVTEESN